MTRLRLILSAGLLGLAAVGASAAAQGQAADPSGSAAQGAGQALPAAPPNYVVGSNDRLRIQVWNQDNISGDYTVSGDGSFTFPLIGRVEAAGRTVANLEGELRRMLGAGYFKNPQVTVSVLDYRSKRFFVMGALRQPGAYPLVGDMTLVEALARAGSVTSDAADHAFIIRSPDARGPVLPGEDASSSVTRIDLREFDDGQLSAVVLLHDGDTIFVPRASTVYVYGQVRSPGAYPIGQETTVRQALSLAGGVSEFGAVNRLRVLRKENGKERELEVQLNDVVQAGDTIVVPERFF